MAKCLQESLCFPGRTNEDPALRIFKLGTPTPEAWPVILFNCIQYKSAFPIFPPTNYRDKVGQVGQSSGIDLLSRLLTYQPEFKIYRYVLSMHVIHLIIHSESSQKQALEHPYLLISGNDKSIFT
jgi:hypothetical protein